MKIEQLDPRGPRFGAGISSILMLLVNYLSLDPASESSALLVMGFAVVMFTCGSILGPARHPYSYLYKYTLRAFLKAPAYLEPATPVHFAQVIGLVITGLGLGLGLLGVPYALPIAAAAAFMAAFVNAVFAYCIGCQMYLGLKRLGAIR
jgi:putative Mn2+ efflux pump MntP